MEQFLGTTWGVSNGEMIVGIVLVMVCGYEMELEWDREHELELECWRENDPLTEGSPEQTDRVGESEFLRSTCLHSSEQYAEPSSQIFSHTMQ